MYASIDAELSRQVDHARTLPLDSHARRIARTAISDLLNLRTALHEDLTSVLFAHKEN